MKVKSVDGTSIVTDSGEVIDGITVYVPVVIDGVDSYLSELRAGDEINVVRSRRGRVVRVEVMRP